MPCAALTREVMVLTRLARTKRNHPADVAMTLGLSDRMAARVLLVRWVEGGWLEVADQIPPGTAFSGDGVLQQQF